MHGYNTPRHQETSEKGYQVHDIWYTIQGEGPFAGLPAVFIRLTGCLYKCWYCDTSWDDQKDPYLSAQEILGKVKVSNPDCKLIVLTGGEPTNWDLTNLIDVLAAERYEVQIETAGPHWQECFNQDAVTIVCCPKVSKVHPKILEQCDHWKYVVTAGDASAQDGLPLLGTQRPVRGHDQEPWKGGAVARPPRDRKVEIYLQPCDEGDPIKNKANQDHMVQIALKYGYRAGLQLHKIFNLP